MKKTIKRYERLFAVYMLVFLLFFLLLLLRMPLLTVFTVVEFIHAMMVIIRRHSIWVVPAQQISYILLFLSPSAPKQR